MALKNREINPLEVLNSRQLEFIPHHFEQVPLTKNIDIKILDHWILFNLNSRYAIKKAYVLDNDKKIVNSLIVGFEDPKEATIFILSCPYL